VGQTESSVKELRPGSAIVFIITASLSQQSINAIIYLSPFYQFPPSLFNASHYYAKSPFAIFYSFPCQNNITISPFPPPVNQDEFFLISEYLSRKIE
jgi:hypothetical protein